MRINSINNKAIENASPKEMSANPRAKNRAIMTTLEAIIQITRNVIMINHETHVLSLAPMDFCSSDKSTATPSNVLLRDFLILDSNESLSDPSAMYGGTD